MNHAILLLLIAASTAVFAELPAKVLNRTPVEFEIQYNTCENDGSHCTNGKKILKVNNSPFHINLTQNQYIQIDRYTYFNTLDKKFVTESFYNCIAPCPGTTLNLHLNKWRAIVCGCQSPSGRGCVRLPGGVMACE
jgi:hypothetical protein